MQIIMFINKIDTVYMIMARSKLFISAATRDIGRKRIERMDKRKVSKGGRIL